MIDVAFQGYGKVAIDQAWPFLFDTYPTDQQFGTWWQYDPKQAMQLLQAAGASGLEFTLQTSAPPGAIREAVVAGYAAIGVNEKLQVIPYGSFIANYSARNGYEDATSGTFTGSIPIADYYYHDRIYSTSPTNGWNINDPQIDQWADQQRVETDPQTRRGILLKIWNRLQDQVYKVEDPTSFGYIMLSKRVRYYRFQGPYLSVSTAHDFGSSAGFHKAWLAG